MSRTVRDTEASSRHSDVDFWPLSFVSRTGSCHPRTPWPSKQTFALRAEGLRLAASTDWHTASSRCCRRCQSLSLALLHWVYYFCDLVSLRRHNDVLHVLRHNVRLLTSTFFGKR